MCRYHNQTPMAIESNPYRLPRHVLPESYKLHLAPNLDTGDYTGQVSINVKISKPTDEIVVNAITFEDPETCKEKVLEIGEATISRDNGTVFQGIAIREPKTQRLRIKVNGTIGAGNWNLTVKFASRLNERLVGFYRSSYKLDGKEQFLGTTQFQSTDARRAFPCFDEPNMKATYQLTLEVDENYPCISNTMILKETLVPGSRKVHEEIWGEKGADGQPVYHHACNEIVGTGRKIVEFAPTMKMSTYLLAFVVGKLVPTKPVSVDGIEVRVWCTPGKEHLTKFALKVAQFSLRYYRNYFGVAYPGDKLDLVAVPDFKFGAMENLGCVTFREDLLLVDEDIASQDALLGVAHVVAHELAHMWFGDLVTMDWWNGLWLNEAFATLMENKCVNAWKAIWAVWDKFGLSRARAFSTDALTSTRTIEYPVVSPADAESMVDVLTYEKGCSVLRMLEMFMGEETFRKGIARYIQEHSYGNTEASDLWAALSAESGLPVESIMHGWILTPGFPVVAVSTTGDNGSITLTQSQFKFLAAGVNAEQNWQIPVMLRAKTDAGIVEMKHLLTAKEETVYLGEGLDWVVVNAGGFGFYRVLYSPALASKLTAKPFETLSVIERVNLVNDAWACVQAGLSNSPAFVSLVKLFAAETDPNVWASITGPLARLRRMLPEGKRDMFESMVRDLVSPALARLTWQPKPGESAQESELRGDLVSTLALTGNDQAAQAKAEELFAAWKKDRNSLDAEVLSAVVSIVAANGDEADYAEFYSLFKAAVSPEDEGRFRSALAGFRKSDLLDRTLKMCIDPKQFRTQDAPSMVVRVMMSELGGNRAWEFVKNNWDAMKKLYPDTGLVRICSGVSSLTGSDLEADVSSFLKEHPLPVAGKSLAQYMEMQKVNCLLRKREEPVLLASFAQTA